MPLLCFLGFSSGAQITQLCFCTSCPLEDSVSGDSTSCVWDFRHKGVKKVGKWFILRLFPKQRVNCIIYARRLVSSLNLFLYSFLVEKNSAYYSSLK